MLISWMLCDFPALGPLGCLGGCFGNTRIFLPLFMCASTVHFSQRNGSLIDFLNVRTRLSLDKYLRLTTKGDHHRLKNKPKNYFVKSFPSEGDEMNKHPMCYLLGI